MFFPNPLFIFDVPCCHTVCFKKWVCHGDLRCLWPVACHTGPRRPARRWCPERLVVSQLKTVVVCFEVCVCVKRLYRRKLPCLDQFCNFWFYSTLQKRRGHRCDSGSCADEDGQKSQWYQRETSLWRTCSGLSIWFRESWHGAKPRTPTTTTTTIFFLTRLPQSGIQYIYYYSISLTWHRAKPRTLWRQFIYLGSILFRRHGRGLGREPYRDNSFMWGLCLRYSILGSFGTCFWSWLTLSEFLHTHRIPLRGDLP